MIKKINTRIFITLITLVFLFSACTLNTNYNEPVEPVAIGREAHDDSIAQVVDASITEADPIQTETSELILVNSAQNETPELSSPNPIASDLKVIFFDVGQADCALITDGEHSMLIDAGDVGQDERILGFLSENNIFSLDYLIATHPHADHIGSMATVIKSMDTIGTILMPDTIHTSKTFENLLDAIEEKNINVTIPSPGEIFEMGNVKIQTIAPNNNTYTDLNNYSIVLHIEYGNTSFLFSGDAEDISEKEQIKKMFLLKADVLKVGHHGSNSSSSSEYLNIVKPTYAVISCAKDNVYGHPHEEIITRFRDLGTTIYRTDENGSITFLTDGNTLTIASERTIETTSPQPIATYIGNKNSSIFHLPTCGTLPAEKNRIYFSSRDEAIGNNYRSCKNCKP